MIKIAFPGNRLLTGCFALSLLAAPMGTFANDNNDDDGKLRKVLSELDRNVKKIKKITLATELVAFHFYGAGPPFFDGSSKITTLDLKRNIATIELLVPFPQAPETFVRDRDEPVLVKSPLPLYVLSPKKFFEGYKLSGVDGPGLNEFTIEAQFADGRSFPKIVAVVDTEFDLITSFKKFDGSGQLYFSEFAFSIFTENGVNLAQVYFQEVNSAPGSFFYFSFVGINSAVIQTNAKPTP